MTCAEIKHIFKDMPENPKRRLYELTVSANPIIPPYARQEKEKKLTQWIYDHVIFTPLIQGCQIFFASDADPKWLLSELYKIGGIGATLVVLKPESLFSTFDNVWLYAYYYHKASGYIYPEETEVMVSEL